MGKRVLDLTFAVVVLLLASPLLLAVILLVWLHDRQSPFYRARRVGKGGRDFTMIKIRSMTAGADKSGVNSTGADDRRITPIGHFIRRFKIDEVSQFANVLVGDMSVVGPRPNTRSWGVDLYTAEEMELLNVKPGITDLSSIVFSDEGAILSGSQEPDVLYNQIIRPWKSRLGLIYVSSASLIMDLQIITLTALAIIRNDAARGGVVRILKALNADPELIEICRRQRPLVAAPPPGASKVFAGS